MTRRIDPDELAFKAMKVLDDYFDTPAKSRDIEATRAARIASSYLSTWATIKQSDNAFEAMRVMVARELAGPNGEAFKRAMLNGNSQLSLPAGGKRR